MARARFEILHSLLYDALFEELTAREKRMIDRAIDDRLRLDADRKARGRKVITCRVPWEQQGPVWQLEVVPWRVLYDIVEEHVVLVQAIGWKGDRRTTQEMIDEIARFAEAHGFST